MVNTHHITRLLQEVGDGNSKAFDEIFPFVYDELHEIAHRRLQRQRQAGALNTTALVHEAYLKLIDHGRMDWQDRAHFFAVASRAMRYILLDYARQRTAQKRGGNQPDVPLETVQVAADDRAAELLSLNRALEALMEKSERQGQLIEFRFFGGLSYQEIAEVMDLSVATVKRDWKRARTWLYAAMTE